MKHILALLLAALAFSATAQSALPPFTPKDTTHLSVTGSAQTLTLPTALSGSGVVQYVLTSFCSASERVYIRSDGTTATTSNGMPVLPNTAILVTLTSAVLTLSVIGDGTSCVFYATVGIGS